MHIGSSISHYKIVEKLGEGGMGVVYKAEDTKLNRQVALKFLAQHLLDDGEAKERFLREAQAAAALHHPNVCPVYEIDEADGKTFLAMAFLKGETLESRISEGPLPIKDALDITRQVADGLQAAHAEGVVHRDIKPANILISPEGRPTIMDFGLARLTEASRLTKVDTAMGTVAYMSPEQAQGIEVDSRTDIWALGCVLYEMVSGQRPFQGQYDQALLYEIVHEEVAPLTSIRAGVPMELEFIVGECLAKDRDDRTGTAQEVSRKLRTLAEKLKSGHSTILRTTQMSGAVPATMTAAHTVNPAEALPPGAVMVQQSSHRATQVLAGVATLVMLALAFVLFTQAPPETPEATVTRFSFAPEGLTEAHISPDGQYILYTAGTGSGSSLWLRSLSDESARELPGTEGVIDGFWSPDSSRIGFAASGPTGQLKSISTNGGSPITLCELPSRRFYGGTWSPDGGRIVFSSAFKLYEISSRGGQPRLLFDPGVSPRPYALTPHFLPTRGGPAALVYSASASSSDRWVAVLNLETGESRELGPGSVPVYSQDGYLIHGRGDSIEQGLWALPFSLASLEPTGEAFPIAEEGQSASVARDGTLLYYDRPASLRRTLVWRSRSGEILENVGQPQSRIREFSLSPDGRSVAVTSSEIGVSQVWIHDLIRATKTRLTFEDMVQFLPAWSPSGREIAYSRLQVGVEGRSIAKKSRDGTGDVVVLVESETATGMGAPDWSRDGRYLIYHRQNDGTRQDIEFFQFGADGAAGQPVTFLSTPARELATKFSPDGRFVAYASDESGRYEIFVRPFPDGAGRWQVSVNGGTQPRWRSDGKELYYVEQSILTAVPVSTGQGVTLGQPEQLFESRDLFGNNPWPEYDASADGQRFMTSAPFVEEGTVPPTIRIVENWHEEFRDRE